MTQTVKKNLLLTTPRFIQQKKYWSVRLAGAAATVPPITGTGAGGNTGQTIEIDIPFTGDLNSHLLKISKNSNLSLYIILLTIFRIFIYRYTNETHSAVLSPVFIPNVSDETLNNRVLVQGNTGGDMSFRQLLMDTRQTLLQAYENQDYPLEELLTGESVPQWPMCRLSNIHSSSPPDTLVDLLFSLEDHNGAAHITGKLRLDSGYFNPGDGQRMAEHLSLIASRATSNVDAPIKDIDILSAEEKEVLAALADGGSLKDVDNKGHSVVSLFERQVRQTPDAVALTGYFQDETEFIQLTYRMLNANATRLARYLKEQGIVPGDIVGVMMERSLEALVGLLAILKAGACYLPIDSANPPERINYIDKDARPQHLLSVPELLRFCNDDGEDTTSTTALNNLETPAYILYTSGSTGTPRGVLVQHGALVNRISWFQRQYPLGPGRRLPLKAPLTVDVSLMETLHALLAGATLVIVPPRDFRNFHKLAAFIQKHRLYSIHLIPSLLDGLLDHLELHDDAAMLESMTRITVGGEPLPLKTLEKHLRILGNNPSIELYQMYGLTEAVIDVSVYRCTSAALSLSGYVPIGKPVAHTRLQVLDRHGNLQPIGVPGELAIQSESLATGYINNPQLTAAKFRSGNVYTTGDRVRLLPDGNLQYLGRFDHQIKVRGFRIEPGEIEKCLAAHPSVRDAVVTAWDDAGEEKFLCAYVVLLDQCGEQELLEHCARLLPPHMAPSRLVLLNEIPLTPGGKIDRQSLPKPQLSIDDAGEFVPPANDIEKRLASIWSGLLDVPVERIGRDGNFFQLGGHSLKAISLMSLVQKEFDVLVPFVRFFDAPVIRALAVMVKNETEKNNSGNDSIFQAGKLEPVEEKQYYPLSSAQRRLYILQKLNPRGVGYNMPKAVTLEGAPDLSRLRQSIARLIQRHEGLRTSFHTVESAGQPVQVVHPAVECQVSDVFTIGSGIAGQSPETLLRGFIQPFDLSQAPLFRVRLEYTGESEALLMFDLHHIICDGASLEILIADFLSIYDGKHLEPLTLQYKDFASWQDTPVHRAAIDLQREYWLELFSGPLPDALIPADFPRDGEKTFVGRRVPFNIPNEHSTALRTLIQKEEVTPYMILLTIYTLLLASIMDRRDIVVGTAVSGRLKPELEPIVGMFVNMLPLRNQPVREKNLRQYLQDVKLGTLNAFENQEYPFEDLVEQVAKDRKAGHNPLFEVIYSFQSSGGARSQPEPVPGLNVKPMAFQTGVSKFDLVLFATESKSGFSFAFEYNTALFKEETISLYIRYFKEIVSIVAEHVDDDIRLGDIRLSHDLIKPQARSREIEFEF